MPPQSDQDEGLLDGGDIPRSLRLFELRQDVPGLLWDSLVLWRKGKPQLLLVVRNRRQQREAFQPGG